MKTDKELADEYRAEMSSALAVVNGIVDAAKEHGLFITYGTADDPLTNKQKIAHITITKKL